MNETLTVGIADAKIVSRNQTLVTYALGSCVGVCLYDAAVPLAGMVHILLPCKEDSTSQDNEFKFADSGIRTLMNRMMLQGADKKRISAKIAGGAEMFQGAVYLQAIGERNIKAVKDTLHSLHIPIVAEDTGKNYGRSIWFFCENGDLKIKTVNHGIQII